MTETSISDRRAVEALRAGVPNGDAVRALGTDQSEIIRAFEEKLANAAEIEAASATGFVISGTFGSGKSHLVEELHQRALANNYVSSKVAISKETPLNQPQKVVQAIVASMQSKDKPDGLLLDMVLSHKSGSPAALDLKRWCGSRNSQISVMFRSMLELRDAGIEDLDVVDLVTSYFAGETVSVPAVKKHIVRFDLDAPTEFVLVSERPWQTVRFLSRFVQVSGYRGWAIFLDETELISKYGPIARARAYAQLGRWLGLRPQHRVAGTAVIATVINDFAYEVLGARGDRWTVPQRLKESKQYSDIIGAPFAEEAIAAIDDALYLQQMTLEQLRRAHGILRYAHGRAYGWDAPELDIEFRQQPMRLYVRRWINEWDLRRLYGSTSLNFGEEDLKVSFAEDDDFDVPDWEDDAT